MTADSGLDGFAKSYVQNIPFVKQNRKTIAKCCWFAGECAGAVGRVADLGYRAGCVGDQHSGCVCGVGVVGAECDHTAAGFGTRRVRRPTPQARVMGEFFSALPIEGGVVVGFVVGVFLMIARGVLVVGAQHREQLDAERQANTYLRSALDKALTLNGEDAKTIAKLSATSDLSARLLEEWRKESAQGAS